MATGWVGVDELLSTYADDLDDPRALEEAERIQRAQQRAREVVEHVLASRTALDTRDEPERDELDDLVEDDFDEGYL